MPNKPFPILDKLGGPDAAVEKLRAAGFERSKDALRMAVARASLPGETMRELMTVADAEGIAYDASDFVVPPASDLAAPAAAVTGNDAAEILVSGSADASASASAPARSPAQPPDRTGAEAEEAA